jgi:hypothetical protein
MHQRIGLLPKESICITRRLRIQRQRGRGDLNGFHNQLACFFRQLHTQRYATVIMFESPQVSGVMRLILIASRLPAPGIAQLMAVTLYLCSGRLW